MLGMLQSHGVAKLQIRLKDWTTNSEADLVPSGLTVSDSSRSLLWWRKFPQGDGQVPFLALCKAGSESQWSPLTAPYLGQQRVRPDRLGCVGGGLLVHALFPSVSTFLSPLLPSTFPSLAGVCQPRAITDPSLSLICHVIIRHRQPMGWGQGWLRRWEGSINSSIWMIRKWSFSCVHENGSAYPPDTLEPDRVFKAPRLARVENLFFWVKRKKAKDNQLLGPILSALRILFPHLTSLFPVLQTAGFDLWAATLPELNLCLETEDISLRAQMAIVRGPKDQLLLFWERPLLPTPCLGKEEELNSYPFRRMQWSSEDAEELDNTRLVLNS